MWLRTQIWTKMTSNNPEWPRTVFHHFQHYTCFKISPISHIFVVKTWFSISRLDFSICVYPYHVTYQPITNSKGKGASVGQPRMIKAKEPWFCIKTLEMVLHWTILTICQFPDLPIEFCEYWMKVSVLSFIYLPKIAPNSLYLTPVPNGSTYKVFGDLHWSQNSWRHRYDSYNLNFGIKSSDSEFAGYLKRLNIFSLSEQ